MVLVIFIVGGPTVLLSVLCAAFDKLLSARSGEMDAFAFERQKTAIQ